MCIDGLSVKHTAETFSLSNKVAPGILLKLVGGGVGVPQHDLRQLGRDIPVSEGTGARGRFRCDSAHPVNRCCDGDVARHACGAGE